MPILKKIKKLANESGSPGFLMLNLSSYGISSLEKRFKTHANGNNGNGKNASGRCGYRRLPDGNRLTFHWKDRHEVNFIVNEIYNLGIYDRMGVPGKGDTVVDIGGHIGVYTLRAARSVGKNGRVITVEPSRENFQMLAKNVADNGLEHVTIVNTALAEAEGTGKLFLDGSGRHSLVIKREGGCVDTPLTTLDNLVEKLKLTRIDKVKIDVEGAEMAVLKGGKDALKNKIHSMAIAAYHSPTEVEEIIQYLKTVAPHFKVKVVASKEESPEDRFLYAYV